MYDDDDDDEDEDGIETNNNHIYEGEDLDIAVEEFDSNRKDYKRRSSGESDPDSFSISSREMVEGCNLSTIYQGEWLMDRTVYWNEDGDNATVSSLEGALNHDTASIMSFDSSMTTSSAMNHLSDQSDQSKAKADVVYTLLSMLQTHDKMEVSQKLLSMSSSRENCIAMIESGCLPLLVQLLHDRNEKQLAFQQTTELRKRASQILRNVVFSQPDDKKGRREARVLRLLEQVRDYCDYLRESSFKLNDNESAKSTDQQLGPTVAALMKLSFDEEHRHAMCLLGALQAIAELIEIDQEVHGCTSDQYCIMIRRYSGMALTNLTFGDGTNKALLCSMKPFMQALVAQLHSPSEELRQVSASVLRNLSWRADIESKHMLREVGAVTTLMKAAMEATKESTLKSILSALWNLSAHCSENKADICRIDGALGFLVGTLTYKSNSKNLAVVENGGGILRNISSHIAIQNDHRITLRKHNCLQILLHHLKSPSLTVVSNACGTLWNLSARNAQDQRLLWELGAVGMLKKLINSKHKMISMGSSAALKNLLSAVPPGLGSGFGVPLNEYNSGMPSLHVRKQKVLNAEIDQNLSETYDNTDSPKSSPTHRKKSTSCESRRPHSAPVYKQGIPQRVVGRAHSISNTQVVNAVEKPIAQEAPKYSSPSQSPQKFSHGNVPHKMDSGKQKVYKEFQTPNNKAAYPPSTKDLPLRVGSPSNMRPYSYPSRKEKYNLNQELSSHSLHIGSQVSRTRDIRSRSPAYPHPRKILPASNDYSTLASKMTNINFDDNDFQEQPVNYSLKYTEESSHTAAKSGADSKIPLPKHVSDSSQSPVFVKDSPHHPRNIAKVTMRKNKTVQKSNYSHYTETELEMDQVVDYSQKYQERDNTEECSSRGRQQHRSLFSGVPVKRENSKIPCNSEDTMKVYCTEDTPVNFSSSSSLTDLCEIGSTSSRVQDDFSHRCSRDTSVPSSVGRSPSNRDSQTEREAVETQKKGTANVKLGEDGNCAETPLMFSRCSSLSSLSSFDQPSIHDDSRSVSDFSRLASGVISPSDLPDSPSEVMPPSPCRKKPICSILDGEQVDASQDVPDSSHPEADISDGGAFEEVQNTYMVEGTPVQFSTASSLSSLSIEKHEDPFAEQNAKIFIKCPVSESVQMKSPEKNDMVCEVAPVHSPTWGRSFAHATDPAFHLAVHMKSNSFSDDSVRIYETEGTPNLSHSASFSDLSNLSFSCEKNLCERSLEGSCKESEGSSEDVDIPSVSQRDNLRFGSPSNTNTDDLKKVDNSCEKHQKELKSPISHDISSVLAKGDSCPSADEDTELLLKCIEMGMPKPKEKKPLPRDKQDDNKSKQNNETVAQVGQQKLHNVNCVQEVQISDEKSNTSNASGHGMSTNKDIGSPANDAELLLKCIEMGMPKPKEKKKSLPGTKRGDKKADQTSNGNVDNHLSFNKNAIDNSQLADRKSNKNDMKSSSAFVSQNNFFSPVSKVSNKSAVQEQMISTREACQGASSSRNLYLLHNEAGKQHIHPSENNEEKIVNNRKNVEMPFTESPVKSFTQNNNSLVSDDDSEKTALYDKALLRDCIALGMPKKKDPAVQNDHCGVEGSHSKVSKSASHGRSEQSIEFSHTSLIDCQSSNSDKILEKSQSEMHPKVCTDMKQTDMQKSDALKSNNLNLVLECAETELSDYDKALVEQCILMGMPKRSSKKTSKNKSTTLPNCHPAEPSLDVSVSPTHAKDAQTSEDSFNGPVVSCTQQKSNISGFDKQNSSRQENGDKQVYEQKVQPLLEEKYLVRSPSIEDSCSSITVSGDNKELSDEMIYQQCVLAGMPKRKNCEKKTRIHNKQTSVTDSPSRVADSSAKANTSSSSESSSQVGHSKDASVLEPPSSQQSGKPSLEDEELLQECIMLGMPKAKGHRSHQSPKDKASKSFSSPVNDSSSGQVGLPAKYLSSSVIPKNDEDNSEASSKQDSILVTEASANEVYNNSEFLEYLEPSDYQAQENTIEEDTSSSASKQETFQTCQEFQDSSGESTNELSREAKKIADDMLEAVVDSTEDMAVSTLSCLSDIDDITPPSAMGEMGSLSLTNSGFGDELKLAKASRFGGQKKSLLKELQLSKLGSDPNLSDLKCQMSDSAMSLSVKSSSSTDILENINPPSVLEDISLTASTGSLSSLQSNILDSKSHEVVNIDASDNSMNERMCEAAAMVEMYTKEFSNMTGIKSAKSPECVSFEASAVQAQMIKDVLDDITEPACDTIASDIDIVEELPCDDDDPGSETLLGPQLSSLNKDEPGDGSTENLTLTLTEENLGCKNYDENVEPNEDDDAFDVLRENADLILNTLKKVHISESSDFGCLAAHDMLEDETLSLVSNESDDDSLSPDGIFVEKQGSTKSNNGTRRRNGTMKPNGTLQCQQTFNKGQSQIPSLPFHAPGHKKFGFQGSVPPGGKNSHITANKLAPPPTDSPDHPVPTGSFPTASQPHYGVMSEREYQTTEAPFDSRTFTRKKPSTQGNIPTVSHQQHREVSGVARVIKSPTCSSHESIESCSTSLSSLSSGDASSNKSQESKRNIPSKIVSIWKSSKMRSKSSADPGRSKSISLAKQYVSGSDRERSMSPSKQRPNSQSSSPQALSRSSTEEKINTYPDATRSLKRPTTLTLSKKNEVQRSNTRAEDPSPSSEASQRSIGKNIVSPSLPSPASQGRSNLPVLKSMIPMSSKIGTGERKAKAEHNPDASGNKPKPCLITMV